MILLNLLLGWNMSMVTNPIKNYYNRNILEFAISKAQPALTKAINSTIVDAEKDFVRDAPKWLRGTLCDILQVPNESADLGKTFGLFQPLFNLLYKVFSPIVDSFKKALSYEIKSVLFQYQKALKEEINAEIRSTFSIKKRGILHSVGKWYRSKVDGLVARVVAILNAATYKTVQWLKNDLGNKLGKHLREIINWFMPEEWKIHDLKWAPMDLPPKRSKFNPILYIKNKIKEIILFFQNGIQKFVDRQFDSFGNSISDLYYNTLMDVAKKSLPFYNRTLTIS